MTLAERADISEEGHRCSDQGMHEFCLNPHAVTFTPAAEMLLEALQVDWDSLHFELGDEDFGSLSGGHESHHVHQAPLIWENVMLRVAQHGPSA